MLYITKAKFTKLLEELKSEYEIYLPHKKGNQRFYKKYIELDDSVVIGEVRPFEPLKAFFSRAREIVAEGFESYAPNTLNKPICIVGVKACDLKGFKIQDCVFKNHDYQDPFYVRMRQQNLIISADCTCAIDTCFCLALGIKPYPQEDFDLNLSLVQGGFTAEVGSSKGKSVIDRYNSLFEEAPKAKVDERNKQRDKVVKAVEANIKENKLASQDSFKEIIEKGYESGIWEEEAKTCVECGACNTICPTCHCFLLYDEKNEAKMARLRIWDSCLIKDFARVAGGANPRHKLWMRLRNRFEKKFDFFPKVTGVYACTGCGRCISACPAKIDIRRVLNKLVANASR